MNNLNVLLEKYFDDYKKNNKPISVCFRELIPNLNIAERSTHLIHPYPAKLLVHIPYFFLNNTILSRRGDKILDSFCGSGTVLLESVLAGRQPIGADSNPLARLISRTKIRRYDTRELQLIKNEIISGIGCQKIINQPNVVNIDYWFLPNIKKQLLHLRYVIDTIEDLSIKDFFDVCFSNLIKKVSLADPKVSVPVRLNPERYSPGHTLRMQSMKRLEDLETIDIVKKFNEIVSQNIKRYEKLNHVIEHELNESSFSMDARKLMDFDNRELESNSIQLYISSPPYVSAQKYIRSSSLCLGWLGYIKERNSLKDIEKFSIGREHYTVQEYKTLLDTGIKEADRLLKLIYIESPLRAHIAANYLLEMKEAICEATRVLKPGGYFVLIVGNNRICGHEFKTQEYLSQIVESNGLKVILEMIDDIRYYSFMTKRNNTADIITKEYIMVFKKE